MAVPKTQKTKIEARTKPYILRLKKYASENSRYTSPITYGNDSTKTNKAGQAISRGVHTYPSRQCSAHLRKTYPQSILQDRESTEFCGNCRSVECAENECRLCNIETDTDKWQQTEPINISEVCGGFGNMLKYFGANYPNNKKYTILRIRRNTNIMFEYYAKLIPYTQLTKTSAPTGYKYKDRITLSKCIKIGSNDAQNEDVIFQVISDEVHCVGFWNLLADGGIRTYLQFQQEQACGVYFNFLMDKNSIDLSTLDVEIIVTRHGMKDEIIPLWHWDRRTALSDRRVDPMPQQSYPQQHTQSSEQFFDYNQSQQSMYLPQPIQSQPQINEFWTPSIVPSIPAFDTVTVAMAEPISQQSYSRQPLQSCEPFINYSQSLPIQPLPPPALPFCALLPAPVNYGPSRAMTNVAALRHNPLQTPQYHHGNNYETSQFPNSFDACSVNNPMLPFYNATPMTSMPPMFMPPMTPMFMPPMTPMLMPHLALNMDGSNSLSTEPSLSLDDNGEDRYM